MATLYTEQDLDQINYAIEQTPAGPEKNALIKQSEKMVQALHAQEAQARAEAVAEAKATREAAAKQAEAERQAGAKAAAAQEANAQKHAQALELERERQRTAQIKVEADQQKRAAKQQADADAARKKAAAARTAAIGNTLHRSTVGRESSNKKILGDTLTAFAVGAGTAIWTATRPGASGFFWGAGLTLLGALTMLESQPGTFLESAGAGLIGGNGAATVLHALDLAK